MAHENGRQGTQELVSRWIGKGIEEKRRLVRELGFSIKWVEIPTGLGSFIKEKRFLGHPPLSDIQLEAVYETSEIFDLGAARKDPTKVIFRERQPVESCLVWGMGSGKDTVAMIIHARLLYLLGCLVDPLSLLTLFRSEPVRSSGIDFLNVAVNKDQAEGRFFDPLKRMIRNSPWFMEKLQVQIMDSVIHAPPIIGHDDRVGDMYAVNAWSGHSSQEAMMGGNLLCVILDEIDAFRSLEFMIGGNKRTRSVTAESMYDSLTATVQSRFPGIGKVALLSWPRYAGSFIEQRLAIGRDDPRVFTSGPYATWEVNPTKEEDDFADEFRRNPERAKAKFMARPSQSMDRYFTNVLAILQAFHADQGEDFTFSRSKTNPGPEPPVDYATMMLRPGAMAKPDPHALYCWHIDLGLKKDRAALAMSHHIGFMEGEGEALPVVQLDLVYWWTAPEGGEIDFSAIRQFILSVARQGYRTVSVTLDGFQSVDTKQILRRYSQYGDRLRFDRQGNPMGTPISAEHFSMDSNLKGYDTLKEVIYEEGRLRAFFCPLLVKEILGLVLIHGRKVDHLAGGSKDVSDAVGGAVFGAISNLSDAVSLPAYRGASAGSVIVGAKRQGQWGVNDREISPSGVISPDGTVQVKKGDRPRIRIFG